MNRLFFSLLLSLVCFSAAAQDPLTNRFLLYSKAKANTNLFVHFDKNTYSSNEMVYFSAYVVTSSNINRHKLLSVSLINEVNNAVIYEDRFLMSNGIAYGTMAIPDSIQPGQYRLLAITDYQVNKQPELSFTQPIVIKSTLEPAFKASMKILENTATSTRILVSATTADNRFLPKPTEVHYTYGNLKNTAKTDGAGQAIITLPSGQALKDPTVYLNLKYEGDSTALNMPIPQPKASPSVKFYPEGGNLVTGLINNIGLEVKTHQQKPIAVKAFLLKDDVAIDSSITTNTNGLGAFKIFIEENAKYTFKVVGSNLKDTIYHLPPARQNGIVLNIPNAVVTDTLRISIRAKAAETINLRVHNFKESFILSKINVQPGIRTLKIPLTQMPKGLASVTITDDEERPIAERIFFAHYDASDKVIINLDKPSYGLREKVNLSLKLNDVENQALVSVAVVQDARFAAEKMTDIESYTYLKNQLQYIFATTKGTLYKDQKLLEQVLLVKGWSRYTWDDLTNVKATDTVKKHENLRYVGRLLKGTRAPNKSVSIGAMGSGIKLISTDNKGVFDFNDPKLYNQPDKKMFLFLNKTEDQALKFSINNELFAVATKFALNPNTYIKEVPPTVENNADLFVKSNEKSIRLQEVTITAKPGSKGLRGRNACGDYVCSFGVFNCQNHFGSGDITQPVAGKLYKIDGISKAYIGCDVKDESIFFKAEGVHLRKEFYVDTYSDPIEPAYLSTIFWSYAQILDNGKNLDLQFYTTDIMGKFRVVVQGITDKKVIYADKFFEVKRK